MIKTVDVGISSSHPNMPLETFVAFVDSPSCVKIKNVPKCGGLWTVDRVVASVVYPDGSDDAVECVKVGDSWIGTLRATNVVGHCKRAFIIIADGKDETGEAVEGLVLGVGDVCILNRECEIVVNERRWLVRFLDNEPSKPLKGDLIVRESDWLLYNGLQWVTLSISEKVLEDYYTKTEVDNIKTALEGEIPTKVSQLTNDKGYLTTHQSLANYYTKSEVDTKEQALDEKVQGVLDLLSKTERVGFTTANKSNLKGYRYQKPGAFRHDMLVTGVTVYSTGDNTSYPQYADNVYMQVYSITEGGEIGEYLAVSTNRNAITKNNTAYSFVFEGFLVPEGYALGFLFTTSSVISDSPTESVVRLRVDNNGEGAWYKGTNGSWYANFIAPMTIQYRPENVLSYIDTEVGGIERSLREING